MNNYSTEQASHKNQLPMIRFSLNISHDEAVEEYENWESDPSQKYFKGGEEGIEFIIDTASDILFTELSYAASIPAAGPA